VLQDSVLNFPRIDSFCNFLFPLKTEDMLAAVHLKGVVRVAQVAGFEAHLYGFDLSARWAKSFRRERLTVLNHLRLERAVEYTRDLEKVE
jgi:hypothetical protein